MNWIKLPQDSGFELSGSIGEFLEEFWAHFSIC
jgi:hypothetical protein